MIIIKKNGNTLDYKINTEKVQIDGENLKKFLSSYATAVEKQLKSKEIKDEVLEIGGKLLDKAGPVTDIVTSMVNIGKLILKKNK